MFYKRMADVYEALLVSYTGGKAKMSIMREIAEKWGVHLSQICKDREKIIRMIRETINAAQERRNERITSLSVISQMNPYKYNQSCKD